MTRYNPEKILNLPFEVRYGTASSCVKTLSSKIVCYTITSVALLLLLLRRMFRLNVLELRLHRMDFQLDQDRQLPHSRKINKHGKPSNSKT
jgi:hypothetical protein